MALALSLTSGLAASKAQAVEAEGTGQIAPPRVPPELLDRELAPLAAAVASDPAQAGQWLDLALGLCRKGHSALTTQVLDHIERQFSPPDGIATVIGLVRRSGCDGPPADAPGTSPPRARASLSVQRGHESNVNQGAANGLFELGSAFPGVVVALTPEFLPVGDRYVTVDAGLQVGEGEGLQWAAQWRSKRHDNQRRFDLDTVVGALERAWRCGAAVCSATGTLGAIGLGGRLYQTLGQGQLGWAVPLGDGPQAPSLGAELGVARQRFVTQPNFDAWLAQARAQWRVPLAEAGLLQMSLAWGVDQATGARPGGDRRLTQLGALGNHPVGGGYVVDWNLQRQVTTESGAYSPGLIDATRRPVLLSLVTGLSAPVARSQRVRLEWRQVDHRDTVSLFTYRNRGLSLTWVLDFHP